MNGGHNFCNSLALLSHKINSSISISKNSPIPPPVKAASDNTLLLKSSDLMATKNPAMPPEFWRNQRDLILPQHLLEYLQDWQ